MFFVLKEVHRIVLLTQVTFPSIRVNCYLFLFPKLTPSNLKDLRHFSKCTTHYWSVSIMNRTKQTKQIWRFMCAFIIVTQYPKLKG